MKGEEYEIKFWKEWLKGNLLEKHKLVKKLPLFKTCLKMKDTKAWKDSFDTLINGYFEDLESAVYTKVRIENKKEKSHKKK
ncbi:MAG: hypothetical protein KJ600_06695 [Nanoarchaeota archaeon]|nr:hypothetical protein [Nanoarchaeota archaeon]MBU1104212.1 hypothetical protein [Nanoarchaeota archaeon]